jgi:hypothetical protein
MSDIPNTPTTKARHPCAGHSKATKEVFEIIATGGRPACATKTLYALERAGLIEKIGEEVIGRDALGVIKLPVYEVPLPIHMQWCQWASENVSDEEWL